MRDAFGYSVLFHAAVFVIGYAGLPYFKRPPVLTDAPIMVEIVNVDELTNVPPPAPEPEKKPEPEAKQPPPPKKAPKTAAPPPPPKPDPEVAVLPPEPKPKAKPTPKPEPKAKPKPKPKQRLAKVKPRRKPKPPDAFTSVLKTVEKLKRRPKPKEKKPEKKKESFEQLKQMVQALSSPTVRHNPLRPLAISEIDLLRQQIRECWSLPAGAKDAENLSIEIRMAMNPDATVREARILDQGRLQRDPFYRAAAESALRAVLNPRCNPLKLPLEKYNQWRNMILIFDPRDMF